jgi:hypothetical protein
MTTEPTPPAPSRAAERMRRHRERQRDGLRCLSCSWVVGPGLRQKCKQVSAHCRAPSLCGSRRKTCGTTTLPSGRRNKRSMSASRNAITRSSRVHPGVQAGVAARMAAHRHHGGERRVRDRRRGTAQVVHHLGRHRYAVLALADAYQHVGGASRRSTRISSM